MFEVLRAFTLKEKKNCLVIDLKNNNNDINRKFGQQNKLSINLNMNRSSFKKSLAFNVHRQGYVF